MTLQQNPVLRRHIYKNYLMRRKGRLYSDRRPIRPNEQGILLHYLLGAVTLGEALERKQRYHQMLRERLGDGLFRVRHGAGQVAISIKYGWREVDDQALHEATVQSLVPVMHFLQWAVDRPFCFREVQLPWPASEASTAVLRHLTRSVVFDSEQIVFVLAKVDTKLKLVRHLGDLPDYYRHLDYYLTLGYARHIGRENPFLELVTGFFVKHQRFPSLVELSDIVFQSPATIKRALKSQGLTYRQLISDCRYVAARKLLLNPALSIKEIAWRLGYRDDNAFRRAFKNWAGMPPGAWRREHSRDN